MTSKPLVRRTLQTLRKAEFGFFGVVVYTRVQTPRFCGHFSRAGTLLLAFSATRGLRTSWLMVGISNFLQRPGTETRCTAAILLSKAETMISLCRQRP